MIRPTPAVARQGEGAPAEGSMERKPRGAVQLPRVPGESIQLTGVSLMRLRTLLHLALVLVAVPLVGCSSVGSNLPPLPQATSGSSDAGYRLAPNDKL